MYSLDKVMEIYETVRAHGENEAAQMLGIKQSSVERVMRLAKDYAEEPRTGPKILLFDIETAPCRAWVWSMWNEVRDYKFIESDWYMLSFAWKWLGGNTVCHALPDFDLYKTEPKNDIELLHILHKLLDEADIVIAHNLDKFDIRKVNARFIINDMKPPSPYKRVDTLKVAKRHFMFTSNRLDALGDQLGLGRKRDTGGFDLWTRCMDGERDAWDTMVDYNIQDVDLLEAVYLRLRPYMNNHPNFNVYTDRHGVHCPGCGCRMEENGYAHTNVSRFVRYQCTNCGYWGRGRTNVFEKEKLATIVSSVA